MALLFQGVGFRNSRKYVLFEKYSTKRLLRAKGTFVTGPRCTPFPDPMGAPFPLILGNSPDSSTEPRTHWVHGFRGPSNDQMAPNTLTHWVRGCRGVPCPLGARGRGVGAGCGDAGVPGGRWREGRG